MEQLCKLQKSVIAYCNRNDRNNVGVKHQTHDRSSQKPVLSHSVAAGTLQAIHCKNNTENSIIVGNACFSRLTEPMEDCTFQLIM